MRINLDARSMTRFKAIFFVLCLYPLVRWLYLAWEDSLTANPPEFLIRSSGIWCLVLLCVTLSITPLRRWTGQASLIRLRRMAGLFSLFYAVLHTFAWALWEQGLSWKLMWQDVCQRPFVAWGVVAVLLMLWLGITSTQAWMRRLGKNWQRLHRAVYGIALLSLWHFYLIRLGKNNFSEVWVYGAIIAVLLLLRVLWAWQRRRSV